MTDPETRQTAFPDLAHYNRLMLLLFFIVATAFVALTAIVLTAPIEGVLRAAVAIIGMMLLTVLYIIALWRVSRWFRDVLERRVSQGA